MKVAILTQPLRTNFGGILQNYALQIVLKRLGHEPITIDYACRYTKCRWLMGWLKSTIKGRRHPVQFPRYNRAGQENLNKFIHDYIIATKPVNTLSYKVFDGINPDAVVVGSDQVWNPWANVPIYFLGNMYLDFASDFQGRRIAYAASFGGGQWIYSSEWTDKCKELVKKFNAISVREDSGVRLCKEHLGVEAVNVLDPTLLLTAGDYDKLIPYPKKSTNTLFAYVLDASDDIMAFLHAVADYHGLNLLVQGANDDISCDDSIEQWLDNIRSAAMVVTDSFHGTAFAIQYHRTFLSIVNKKRGSDRFTSLLRKLGLLSRLVTDNFQTAFNADTIDWNAVDAKLQKERGSAFLFIQKNC